MDVFSSFKINKRKVKKVEVSVSRALTGQQGMVYVFHKSNSFFVSVNQSQGVFLRMNG